MSDVTTEDLRAMLKARHSGTEWAVFEEVHDSTGYGHTRAADALAFNLWPSKGLEVHGFEIKTSRSDFLNEIRDPDKAERFKQYCDRWWLVGSSKAIVKGDLPQGWGFMWPRSGKLVVSVGAPKLEPKPIGRVMQAAIFRRAMEGYENAAILEDKYQAGRAAGESARQWEIRRLTDDLDRLRKRVTDFEDTTGIAIRGYRRDGTKVGEAVEAVIKLQERFGPIRSLLNTCKAVEGHAAELIASVSAVETAAKDAGLLEQDDDEGA